MRKKLYEQKKCSLKNTTSNDKRKQKIQ